MSGRHGRLLRVAFTYLTQRLTPAGRSLFLIWLIAALQGSVSLDIPIYHICSFTTVCFALAWLTSRFAVPPLQLTRRQLPPVTAGDTLTYEVDIENHSQRAAYGLSVMEMDVPAGLQLARHDASPRIDRLAPHAHLTLSLQFTGLKRGHHRLSGLYAASSYPLGLFRGMSFHLQEAYATVYPAYAVPDAFHLPLPPALTRANRGVTDAHAMAAASPDFAYVREYRHGDNPRHLHWASWARTGIPAVKVYQEETGPRVGLVLDTAVNHPRDMHALESGIAAAAGIAAYLMREAIEVDCFATADFVYPFSHTSPATRLTHLLHTLADLTPCAAVAWPSVATRLLEQAPQCNTIVLIALDWSRETNGFVHQLQHHGLGVRTLVIRQGPTSQSCHAVDAISQLVPGDTWPQEPSLSPWRGP